jgi:hypothetical protein
MSNTKLDPLDEAGKLLLFLAQGQALVAVKNPDGKRINKAKNAAVLANIRLLLSGVPQGHDRHRFMAAKTALETLDAIERGDDVLGGTDVFRGFVEAVHGGPRNLDFGGRKVSRKPTADEAFLKAAAIVLWTKFPEQRERLALEARKILRIRSQRALGKMVDNFHQRHDSDIAGSHSPMSIHMPIVTTLVDNCGYQTLSNFL